MSYKLTENYSLEWLATLITLAGVISVFYTFIIGKHYIIPTAILIDSIIFFNLAFFGFKDKPWAKYVLFWIFTVIFCHTFFSLFWAKTPKLVLGELFFPVYIVVCMVTGFLSIQYARANLLYR